MPETSSVEPVAVPDFPPTDHVHVNLSGAISVSVFFSVRTFVLPPGQDSCTVRTRCRPGLKLLIEAPMLMTPPRSLSLSLSFPSLSTPFAPFPLPWLTWRLISISGA